MSVFGTSGAGKSFFIKSIILRYRLLGIEQYIIDPEREYLNMCKKLEGTIYAIFIGLINTGTIFGVYSGSFLQKLFGITRNNFSNLNQLILFSNYCHLIPVILILFVPSKLFSYKKILKQQKEIELKDIGNNEIEETENDNEDISDEEMEEKIKMKRTISQL